MAGADEKNILLESESQSILSEPVAAKFDLDNRNFIPDKTKKSYHEQRLGQSKWAFRLSFWGGIFGFLVIIWSLKKGIQLNRAEWPGIVSGAVLEAVSTLFYNLSNKANEKISEFFSELTKDDNVNRALALSDQIQDEKIKDELKVKLSMHLAGINEDNICKNINEICKKS